MADDKKVEIAQRVKIERGDDGTIHIHFDIPAQDAEKVRESIVDELVKSVEIKGFRKGAAPKHLAEQKLEKNRVREEMIKKVITDEYIAAVKQNDLKPIINPKVHIEEFEEGTNLKFEAETCEEPQIDLKNYKEEVKKIKPATKIITNPKEESNPSNASGLKLDEILNRVLTVAATKIPKILVDQEADRLLSQLLEELKRLGVDLDQYLASRNKKAEDLRAEYIESAEKDLKLEFILRKIADAEKISVEQADIEQAMNAIKDPEEKAKLAQNPYVVAAIIRQQKTLDFLGKL